MEDSSDIDSCSNCKNKMKVTNWVILGIGITISFAILIWIFIDLRKKHKYKSKFFNFEKT